MKLAIVGVTGLVGQKMLELVLERNLPVDEFILAASSRSVGKKILIHDQEIQIVSMQEAVDRGPDVAIFSAGGDVSLEWAPRFEAKQCYVVDNSSAWRMHPDYKLIVPEVNGDILEKGDYIIANPNCSTIQMVLALNPIQLKYGIDRIVVSTYQSVSGSGLKGIRQLDAERKGETPEEPCYSEPIDLNVIPQIDIFMEDGYTKEERKMMDETKKIMADQSIKVTATAVRVPVIGGHSESVNVSLKKDFEIDELRLAMSSQEGVTLIDDTNESRYPMPIYAEGKNEVYVGRIRRDDTLPQTFNCWIVADNLIKGAALNAVQIVEVLLKKELV